MRSSGIETAVAALESELEAFDVDACSGAVAAALLSGLLPGKRRLESLLLALSARAVACNQHNVDGARSAAARIGATSGISEQQARAQLALQRSISDLPEVASAVRSGAISLEKAAAIGRCADGNESVARRLLDSASSGTVEQVQLRAREIRAHDSDHRRRRRLRNSQFVHIESDPDAMVVGRFRLLPEHATGMLAAFRNAKGLEAWERAEHFAEHVGEAKAKSTEVVFHLDVDVDHNEILRFGNRCELKGVGPVTTITALAHLEHASTKLVGTANNKLVWFAESDRRAKSAPLPDFIKRAIRARDRDRCSSASCVDPASDVDHIVAKTNGGTNDVCNLQALCAACHHAKTKRDAPWTAGGIYGRKQPRPNVHSSATSTQCSETELFPDTG